MSDWGIHGLLSALYLVTYTLGVEPVVGWLVFSLL